MLSRVGRLHGISWPAHAEDVHLVARKLFWGSHESAENSRRRGKDEVRIKKAESAFAQGYGERGGDGVPPRRVAELVFWAIVEGLRSQKYEGESQPPVRAKAGATLVQCRRKNQL